MKTETLRNHLINELTKHEYEKIIYDNKNNYIIAHGEIPVCLIAHIDTVFNNPPINIFYDKKEGVLWSPEGLGGDDRAGIYAILSILNEGLKPHIIFTNFEEEGGVGSFELTKDFPQSPFEECKALIQLDRHGFDDAVFYSCANKEFIDLITAYCFNEQEGLFSDISIIAPAWKIAGVNLSVGFFNEHHKHEFCQDLIIFSLLPYTHDSTSNCYLLLLITFHTLS